MKVLLGSEGWEDEGDLHLINTESTVDDVIKSICPTKVTEEPFYIIDLDDIIKKLNVWKTNLPRVEPFYAVKCNNSDKVIQLLAALGTGFDCASKGEIEQVLSCGVSAERIIYANPCKTRSFIAHANKKGVKLMTFDNETELYKVKDKFPDAHLVLRIKADAADSQCTSFGVKFGADMSAVESLLQTAASLSLQVVGVSFHVGSGCRDNTAFPRAIAAAKSVFNTAKSLGFNMHLLDIGGGFPGHDDGNMTFNELCTGINSALSSHFPVGCGVRIIAEPGRYMVASAFTLATNVIAKRQVAGSDESSESFMYYINDGIYGSFNCLLYDNAQVYPHLPLNAKLGDPGEYKCSIWGPTCDSLDKVVAECVLPELWVGDWLLFSNMGAYTISAATNFNGFIKPALHFSIHTKTWMYLKNNLCGNDVVGSWGETKESSEPDTRSAMLAEWMEESSQLAKILDSLTSQPPAPKPEADDDPASTNQLLRALQITT
jgi:ornithine decarboxylase